MPYLTPDAPTGNRLIRLVVPDTLTPPVLGGLLSIWEPYKWEKFGTLEVNEVMEYIGQVIMSVVEGPDVGTCPCTVVPSIFAYLSYSHALTLSYDSASVWKQRMYMVGALNAYIEYQVDLDAGVWKMEWWHRKGSGSGIITLTVDGTQVCSVDQYAPVAVLDYHTTTPDFTIADSGEHTIRFTAGSKNASSSAYNTDIARLEFVRVG